MLQNIGIPATRLQSQTVCTPCLNLMIADVSNMSRGEKTSNHAGSRTVKAVKNDSACRDGSFDVKGKIGKGRNVWKLRALRPMVVI